MAVTGGMSEIVIYSVLFTDQTNINNNKKDTVDTGTHNAQ